MAKKRTVGRPRGLTRAQARDARVRYNDGKTMVSLAVFFGVSRPTIALAIHGKGIYASTL